jgi:hypothetical protein
MLLGALNRGWIISNASIRGHVWYSLTPAGLAMPDAEHRKPDPPDTPPAPEPVDADEEAGHAVP